MIIYKITNKVNGKIYIGKTSKTAQYRFKRHVQEAVSKNKLGRNNFYFHKALVKYGRDNFSIDVLQECETAEEAAKLEIEYISKYHSQDHLIGYNLTKGGEGVVGRKKTQQEIEKHRQKMIGRKLSQEHKMAISRANKGKQISLITRQKISMKNSGANNGCFGKTQSVEFRKAKGIKISIAKSGKVYNNNANIDKLKEVSRARLSEKIPWHIKNEMVDMYDEGHVTKRELSERFNIPFASVTHILRYWKEVRERLANQPTAEQKMLSVQLRNIGVSYDEISAIVHLPKYKIRNILKTYRKKLKKSKSEEPLVLP